VSQSNLSICGQNRGYKVALNLRRCNLCDILSGVGGSDADVAELADAIDLGSITAKVWRFESSRRHHGSARLRARGLAGRRLLCKEKIVGSNPTGSTF
jgi:hypothetical protein